MSDVDYSEDAVNRRLREVSQLRDLCLSLGKATIIRDAETPSEEARDTDPEQR